MLYRDSGNVIGGILPLFTTVRLLCVEGSVGDLLWMVDDRLFGRGFVVGCFWVS